MERIVGWYSNGHRLLIWSDADRYALLDAKREHALDAETLDRAIDDLEVCEQQYDTLSSTRQRILREVYSNLFEVLTTTSKLVFDASLKVLASDPPYMLELFTKLSAVAHGDATFGPALADRVLHSVWRKLSKDEQYASTSKRRIASILDKPIPASHGEPSA